MRTFWRGIVWLLFTLGVLFLLGLLALLVFQPETLFGRTLPELPDLGRVAIIVAVVDALLAGLGRFLDIADRPVPPIQTGILAPTSLDELRESILPHDRDYVWYDREIVTLQDLERYPVVVIAGGEKCGKNAEACHLVERGIEKGTIDPRAMFDISGFRQDISADVPTYLSQRLDAARGLLFLKELPYPASQMEIERLECFAEAVRGGHRGRLVTTLRSDLLENNPKLRKWLEEYQKQGVIGVFASKKLSLEQKGLLVDDLAARYTVTLTPEGRRILAEEADGGFPYHLIVLFQDYAGRSIAEETLRQDARKSLRDTWDGIRARLVKEAAAVGTLLDALALFHLSQVPTHAELVYALAAQMEREKRGWRARWQAQTRLQQAARMLAPYGITHQDTFRYPEVALDLRETPVAARERLATFLLGYGKLFTRRGLIRFHRGWAAQSKALMALGVAAFISREFEQAEILWRRITFVDVQHVGAWLALGLLLSIDRERRLEAEAAYWRALKIDANLALAWYNLGSLLSEDAERHAEAEAAYRCALEIDENLALAWNNLGLLLSEDTERRAQAEAAYRRALEIDENLAPAWLSLGYLLLEDVDRHEEAEAAYRRALALDEKFAKAWVNLGVLLNEQGRGAEAEAAYRRALDIDENLAQAWVNLGVLLNEQGRGAEAEAAYRRALDIDEKDAWSWNILGSLLAEDAERHAEAEAAYRRALDIDENNSLAWFRLGLLCLEDSSHYAEAEAAFRHVLAINENNVLAWLSLGVLLTQDPNRRGEAEATYRRALHIDEKDAVAWNNLGNLLSEVAERRADAEAAYRAALTIDENDAATWYNLGQLLRSARRWVDARPVLERAVELEPDRAIHHASLGAVYRALGMADAAARELDEALRLSAGESAYNQACIAALCGDLESALPLLDQVLGAGEETPQYVLTDPDWQEWLTDPRFLAVIERYRLPE